MPFSKKLIPRLKTKQCIVWIQTDEPTRLAARLREVVVNFAVDSKPIFERNNCPANIYEHDILNGMFHIYNGSIGDMVRNDSDGKPVVGVPVDFFNGKTIKQYQEAKSNAGASIPTNNYFAAAPWNFFLDMIAKVPQNSFVIAHNLADVIDIALKVQQPDSVQRMRHALLALTGKLVIATEGTPFEESNRMLIATGRLPSQEFMRSEIQDTFDIITFDRPSLEELTSIVANVREMVPDAALTKFADLNQQAYACTDAQEIDKRSARNLLGLPAFAASTAVIRTFEAEKHFAPAALAEQRKSLIERCPALSLVDVGPEFDWHRVKGFKKFEKWVKVSLGDGVKLRHRANACTFVGPGGNGKSMGAKALARHLGWPLVIFNLSRVFNKYIGSSQEIMAMALSILDRLGNCVVLMDEYDKAVSGLISDDGNRGDSGVGSQVMQLLLTWEQERAKVAERPFIIRTCNRIRNIKSESLRAGRNDAIFFVDFPHKDIRREILTQYLGDEEVKVSDSVLDQMLLKTKLWSGDELKALAKQFAKFEDFETAFTFVKPIIEIDPDDVNKLRADGKTSGIRVCDLNIDDEDRIQSISSSGPNGHSAKTRLSAVS